MNGCCGFHSLLCLLPSSSATHEGLDLGGRLPPFLHLILLAHLWTLWGLRPLIELLQLSELRQLCELISRADGLTIYFQWRLWNTFILVHEPLIEGKRVEACPIAGVEAAAHQRGE